MIIIKEHNDDAIILSPRPGIDSSTAKQFEETLVSVIESGTGNVLIDFGDLEYISSAGLRAIIIGAKAAKSHNGKLIVCGMRNHIRAVFDTSGFSKLLPIVQRRQDADFTSLCAALPR